MRRMLYKLLIICLFLILCILLIYFLKKNKQIEKFDEGQEKIIIKIGEQNIANQKIFKYYNNSIELVRSLTEPETVEALFYDESLTSYPKLTTKTKSNYKDIIQVINVALDYTTNYKTFYLKNDQKVYDASARAIQFNSISNSISNTDIIQITPHNVGYFLCLTNYNTLIKITVSGGYNADVVTLTSVGDTSPIISIKGFRRLDCVLYLCMNGDLFYLDTSGQSTDLKSNVIQFNVPTDSDLSETVICYSCIAIDDNNIKKVYFNKFNFERREHTFDRGYHISSYFDELNPVFVHSTWITCTTDTPTSYQYYIIYNENNEYKLMNVGEDEWQTGGVAPTSGGGTGGVYVYQTGASGTNVNNNLSIENTTVFTEIDNKIKSIISYNNELYYLKNGDMACTPPFFTHTDGEQCVSCGSNGSQKDNTDNCQCDGGFDVVDTNNGNSGSYSACNISYGCSKCPPVNCPAGFYESNIDVEILHGIEKQCTMCQLCTGLPSANAKIIKNSYRNGVLTGSNVTSYKFNSNYYIMQVCTPESDTIFGQVTRWDDLQLGDSNYYYSNLHYTGGYKDSVSSSYNLINFSEADIYTTKSAYKSTAYPLYDQIDGKIKLHVIRNDPVGTYIPLPTTIDTLLYDGLLRAGNDVQFFECDSRTDTCGTATNDDITSNGGTLCTNGSNLNCDNLCSNVYSCSYYMPESYEYDIFTTWFTDPSGHETTINRIIGVCDSPVKNLFETKNQNCFVET